jgi:CsoR family transcriptional regulator, copper-sensing transcriptional repressor
MPSMHNLSVEERGALIDRLKKIEGQAKGVQRMIDDGRECMDVVTQLAAIKAAVNNLTGELLEAYALRCITHPEDFGTPEKAVHEAVRALVRAGR